MISKSFRDPAGSVFLSENRIFRAVNGPYQKSFRGVLDSALHKKLVGEGRIIPSRLLDHGEIEDLFGGKEMEIPSAKSMIVEHEAVAFPSYPYEWPSEMLHAAAALTLDLAEELLGENRGLKDATPYNILFRGPNPIFVDLLSIEDRLPGDPLWLPYAQFVRTFLLPLLVNKHFSLPLREVFLTHRDGWEPGEVYPLCGPWQRFLPPFLTLVSLPAWLSSKKASGNGLHGQNRVLKNTEKAKFILTSLLRRLRRQLKLLEPRAEQKSSWSDYAATHTYSDSEFEEKRSFVRQCVDLLKPGKVLDVGCNTGTFSFIAAEQGARVVSIDSDPVVVGRVWNETRSRVRDVLPLVINIGWPSPSVGWSNEECPSFLHRAEGTFDMVFLLAVIHHLMATEGVSFPEVARLAARLTRDAVILEYVGPNDPMFRTLARGRDELYAGFSPEYFENVCRQHFDIVRHQQIGGGYRRLYLLRKRSNGA